MVNNSRKRKVIVSMYYKYRYRYVYVIVLIIGKLVMYFINTYICIYYYQQLNIYKHEYIHIYITKYIYIDIPCYIFLNKKNTYKQPIFVHTYMAHIFAYGYCRCLERGGRGVGTHLYVCESRYVGKNVDVLCVCEGVSMCGYMCA